MYNFYNVAEHALGEFGNPWANHAFWGQHTCSKWTFEVHFLGRKAFHSSTMGFTKHAKLCLFGTNLFFLVTMGFQIGNSRSCDHLSSNLVSSFSVCVFLWVRQDVNQLAYALAKVAPLLPLPFACFCNSLPLSTVKAGSRDLLSL